MMDVEAVASKHKSEEMIVVRYELAAYDVETNSTTYQVLGTDSHLDIEEVLLPSQPTENDPIFFTKKFTRHADYRWEVEAVDVDVTAAQQTYVVVLKRRQQIDADCYLQKILANRLPSAKHVLFPWTIVEVEFGHHFMVGKQNGDIRTNKRYVDTMQRFSMPKRRLAIVTQVFSQRDDLVQVIPISSKEPEPDDRSCIEVTDSLTKMVHYQKRSWAVCRMIQTVTASRIIAPMFQRVPHAPQVRDKSFKSQIRGPEREALKDAIMYGVAADSRVDDKNSLIQANSTVGQLSSQVTSLVQQVTQLQQEAAVYERWRMSEKLTLKDLQEIFP